MVFTKEKTTFSQAKFFSLLSSGIRATDPSKDKLYVYIINDHRGDENNV
jgi:hypothetical protein